ncbi:MAG: multiple sugar transport system substrate-binding protein [Candidatus Sumerlaeota bacterium]|nr:multiple sugar transport system substrate-binding protein [Candidatus Sumerlaeota bacterium]
MMRNMEKWHRGLERIWSRIWRMILPGLAATAVLLSCGKDSASKQAGTERVHVVYWEKWADEEQAAMEELVDRFNRSQDRILVEYVQVTDIRGKLLLATIGHNPPDVAGVFAETILKYSDRDALMPLDHYMERDGISPEDYLPAVIELCEYRGFYWGLPATPASLALHYNKKHFRQAGLDPERPPRTIAELDEYARKLTRYDEDGHIVQLGFAPVEPSWFKAWYIWWFGGEHWDGKSEMTLTTKPCLETFRWVRSFPETYGAVELHRFLSGGGQFRSAQNLFLNEKLSMQLQGVWMANFIESYNPGMEWGVAPFPSVSEELSDVTFVDSDILVIPNGARHPDEAWEFIRFVQRQENMEALCKAQRKFSPLKAVSPEFYTNHPNPNIDLFRHLAESPNAHPVPRFPIVEVMRDEMSVAMDKVWLREDTPEKALEHAEKIMQSELDRRERQWERIAEQRIQEWSKP